MDNVKQPAQPQPGNTPENSEINLSKLFAILLHRKWWIIATGVIAFFLSYVVLHAEPSIYQSDALVQISDSASMSDFSSLLGNIVRGNAPLSAPQSSLGSVEQLQNVLIKSRFVLQPVIDSLGLNAKIISPANAKLKFSQLKVSQRYQTARFSLVAGEHGQYAFYNASGILLFHGQVGRLAQESNGMGSIQLMVSAMDAKPGARFEIQHVSETGLVDMLGANLSTADISQGTGDIGVVRVSLKGQQADRLPGLLDAVTNSLIQRNVEKKSTEMQQALGFLSQELPVVKQRLTSQENALNDYLAKLGEPDMATQVQILLSQVTAVKSAEMQLDIHKAVMSQEVTDKYPSMRALNDQQKELDKQLSALELQMAQLPKKDQKVVDLTRDLKLTTKLYMTMLSDVQQLQLVRSSVVSDVRMLGKATQSVELPNKHGRRLIVITLFALIVASILVLLKEALAGKVGSPEELESLLDVPNYAVIPYSPKQNQLTKQMKNKTATRKHLLLSEIANNDQSVEGLRSLRTAVKLELLSARNNVVSVLGSSPSSGKSFVTANFSYLWSEAGKRVLIIDADLRRGTLNKYFGRVATDGLTEFLMGKCSASEVTHQANEHLSFIAAGKFPDNPSELLMGKRFKQLIDQASQAYDLVIIDSAPILAVSDSMIVGQHSSVNLLIVDMGSNVLRELKHAVKHAAAHNVPISGTVLNKYDTQGKQHSYYYYSNYYRYDDQAPDQQPDKPKWQGLKDKMSAGLSSKRENLRVKGKAMTDKFKKNKDKSGKNDEGLK